MGRNQVERNASEIEKYLEVLLPKLEPRGGIPDAPMARKERGTSRPPVSDAVMRLWEANLHAGLINSVLKEAASTTETVELEGRPMWEVLSDVLWDHTAIRRWKAGEAGGKAERRFRVLCLLLAGRLRFKYGADLALRVVVHPEDEQQREKTREAQKYTTAHTRRLMVEQLEEVEEETGYKGLMAMEILCERKAKEGKDWSVSKLRRAREIVNKEREQAG